MAISWEHPYYPHYYFAKSDALLDNLQNARPGTKDSEETYDLVVGGRVAEGAVTVFRSGTFQGLLKIAFDKADAWFEEDERFYGHPKDPYKVGSFSSISHGDS
jgi:hypothetical protein